uniref:Uncharacterized protein n=1 Tax=Cucumis melo TaxID=3656 RepID=A0A9I9EKY4_CUCME
MGLHTLELLYYIEVLLQPIQFHSNQCSSAQNLFDQLPQSNFRLRHLCFGIPNIFDLEESGMIWSLEWEDNQLEGGQQPL